MYFYRGSAIRMRTEISEVSSEIEASYSVQFQERDTRKRRWEQIDDDFSAGWVSIRTRSIERVMLYSRNVSLRKKIGTFSRELTQESHWCWLDKFCST